MLSLLGGNDLLGIYRCDIRTRFYVGLNYLCKVNACDNVAVRHYNIVGVGGFNEIPHSVKCLKPAAVHTALNMAERREKVQTAYLSCQVPFASASEVIEQGLIVGLSDNAHLVNTAVYHIGKRKVDKAVASSEEYGTHSSFFGEVGNSAVVHI